MATHMVLISVDYNNSRKVCELIENQKYASIGELQKQLTTELDLHMTDENLPIILTISDFMDNVNDQFLDNLSEFFISYVNIG
jgi:hypothetical protein